LNTKTKDIYILSRINGVGAASMKNIIDDGYTSIYDLSYKLTHDHLKSYIKGKNQKSAINIIKNHSETHCNKIELEIKSMIEKSIHIFSKEDKEYPDAYKLLKDAPTFIYAKGNTDLLNWKNSIAIVGTRACSKSGYEIAMKTSKYFADKNYNIVSGLAKGIDTAAHKGALSIPNGKTTAILVDLENIYPNQNNELANQILEKNGLLLSENPPGTIIKGNLLVKRDRLQSGLSLAIFPIETDLKGGTMHTVRFSEEQNRLRFVPDLDSIKNYDINQKSGRGIKELLKTNRANSFTKESYKDIIKKLEKKKRELFLNNSIGSINNKSKQLNLM
jgi:DNA processing protein